MNSDPFADIFGGESIYQTPEDRQQAAFNFFQSRGYAPHQAAGIVGNLMHESGMNTGAVGDKGASFGLAQWNAKRRFNLNSFARKHGTKADDFLTQLMFVDHELNNDESGAADLLRKAQDVREATRIFSEKYERPGKPMMESRLSFAEKLLGGLLGPSQAEAAEFNEDDPFGDITAQPQAGAMPGQATAPPTTPGENLDTQRQQLIDEAINPPNMGYRKEIVRPILEYGGAAVGGMLGTPAGPAGQVGGAALGYATGKKGADFIDYMRGEAAPPTVTESLTETAQDLPTGAMMEMGGQVVGKALGKGIETGGKLARDVLGRIGGVGTYAEEEALKGLGRNYQKALTGKITGEEVVENTRNMFQKIKNMREIEYVARLKNIQSDPTKMQGVKDSLDQKLQNLVKNNEFDIRLGTTPEGKLDINFDTSTIVEHQNVVKKAIEDVLTWMDNTPAGLDVLKKRLGKYIAQTPETKSNPSRRFLTELQRSLKDALNREVPGYQEMTKGYAEASKLIEEAGQALNLKKQGIQGRITADQTLRRLMSSMKESFELRNDIVKALGEKGGEDLTGQIAGHVMSSYIPRSIFGSNVALGEIILAKYFNPWFWPVLAASSPRLQGEFLMRYGRALKEVTGASLPVGKISGYLATQKAMARKDEREFAKYPNSFSIREGKVRKLDNRSPEGHVLFQFPDGTVRPWIPEK